MRNQRPDLFPLHILAAGLVFVGLAVAIFDSIDHGLSWVIAGFAVSMFVGKRDGSVDVVVTAVKQKITQRGNNQTATDRRARERDRRLR